MKRSITNLLILFSVLCVVLLAYDFFGRELAVRSGVLAGSDRLSLWERYQYTKRAEAGDTKAMKDLARYYGIWRNDRKQEMYWIAKSAAAGDPLDQLNYGVYLFEYEHNETEGLRWLVKSADGGEEGAKLYLQLIEEKKSKQKVLGSEIPAEVGK